VVSGVEGPSIHLSVEQLQPLVAQRVLRVSGNSRIGITRLKGRRLVDVFAWGKHLVFQFDGFALRVHFLLWGSFAADIDGVSVTGDYRRTGPPRLVMTFRRGEVTIWSASLRWIELADARTAYDFGVDVLSPMWNPRRAVAAVKRHPRDEIADVLLDQSIFAGVGNIIKNEVLFRTRTHPQTRVARLAPARVRAIVKDARVFSERFLALRREFQLRKNLEIYGRGVCARCGGIVVRRTHGRRERRSFFCSRCQRRASSAPTLRRLES